MTEFEIWYLILTFFYLVVFYALIKYVGIISDLRFKREEEYLELLFKAYVLEEQVKYKKIKRVKMIRFAYIHGKRYKVEDIEGDWVNLSCDGEHISKLVNFEEARRVIYYYWVGLGKSMEFLTEADFQEVQ